MTGSVVRAFIVDPQYNRQFTRLVSRVRTDELCPLERPLWMQWQTICQAVGHALLLGLEMNSFGKD